MTQSIYNNSPESERSRNLREQDGSFDDDTSFEDPRIARERAEERERAEARDAARTQAVDAELESSPRPQAGNLGTSYLSDRSTEEPWQQWRQIQADFVDNPRTAVSHAHGLVGELIDDIVHKFEDERNQLESRWSSGEDVSTEDLRKCLQTYRDFFGRLLSNSSEHKA